MRRREFSELMYDETSGVFRGLNDKVSVEMLAKTLKNWYEMTNSLLNSLDEMDSRLDEAAKHLDPLLKGIKPIVEARSNIVSTMTKVTDLFDFRKLASKPVPIHFLADDDLDAFLE